MNITRFLLLSVQLSLSKPNFALSLLFIEADELKEYYIRFHQNRQLQPPAKFYSSMAQAVCCRRTGYLVCLHPARYLIYVKHDPFTGPGKVK